MKKKDIVVTLICIAAIACADRTYWDEKNQDGAVSGCFVYYEIIDDYLCVNATEWVCDFRVGERADARCEDLELGECGDGIWTETVCPYDEGGACIVTDSGIEWCESLERGYCAYYYPDAEWYNWSCEENGYPYFCNDLRMWVADEIDCEP
jgi:hypothetical protein